MIFTHTHTHTQPFNGLLTAYMEHQYEAIFCKSNATLIICSLCRFTQILIVSLVRFHDCQLVFVGMNVLLFILPFCTIAILTA